MTLNGFTFCKRKNSNLDYILGGAGAIYTFLPKRKNGGHMIIAK
jgi:hypothetical protein